MGSRHWHSATEEAEYRERQAERAALEIAQADLERVKFASKIAMVVVDHINDRVIRPGPLAEERECYSMAQELHDIKPELVALIARIIKVQEDEM